MKNSHVYDMIIVGGGPGGYTAALYAARAGLDALLIEKLSAGGQMAMADRIDNYPSFVEGIEGFLLGTNMQQQAERFGAKTEYAEVISLDLKAEPKLVKTSEGDFLTRTVVLATGAGHRHLGLDNEYNLMGRGVAYCASCDGMFYRGKTVAVVGGGDSAVSDALLLSRIAKKVYLIHRRDKLRATKVYHQSLEQAENIEFIPNNQVVEFLFDKKLTGLRLKNSVSGEEQVLSCEGVFICVGRSPATELVKDQLELDGTGYVVAGEDTQSSLPGVYAVGDVRTKPLRQVVTAVADGATAVYMAESYLSGGDQYQQA